MLFILEVITSHKATHPKTLLMSEITGGLLTETLANPQAIFCKTSSGKPSGARIDTLQLVGSILSLSRALGADADQQIA